MDRTQKAYDGLGWGKKNYILGLVGLHHSPRQLAKTLLCLAHQGSHVAWCGCGLGGTFAPTGAQPSCRLTFWSLPCTVGSSVRPPSTRPLSPLLTLKNTECSYTERIPGNLPIGWERLARVHSVYYHTSCLVFLPPPIPT